MYSTEALIEAARMASALAEECLASAKDFDEAWREHCLNEAARHQDRAEWYLDRAALVEAEIHEPA